MLEFSIVAKPQSTSETEPTSESNESLDKNLIKIAEIVASQCDNGEIAAHNELSLATDGLMMYLNNQVYTAAAYSSYSGIYGSGFGHSTDENAKNDIINLVK